MEYYNTLSQTKMPYFILGCPEKILINDLIISNHYTNLLNTTIKLVQPSLYEFMLLNYSYFMKYYDASILRFLS